MILLSLFSITVKGYSTIDGDAHAENVVFVSFTPLQNCAYGVYAIGNNPLSPDAVHPLHLSTDNLAHYYDPDPEWIVQEVRHCYN